MTVKSKNSVLMTSFIMSDSILTFEDISTHCHFPFDLLCFDETDSVLVFQDVSTNQHHASICLFQHTNTK